MVFNMQGLILQIALAMANRTHYFIASDILWKHIFRGYPYIRVGIPHRVKACARYPHNNNLYAYCLIQ